MLSKSQIDAFQRFVFPGGCVESFYHPIQLNRNGGFGGQI
jgi:hypothetical protein